jgi:chromosomal replication initiator protein
MYLIRQELSLSYPQIGRAVGGKDHSTVMHALKQFDKELAKDSAIQDEITSLKKEIYAQ